MKWIEKHLLISAGIFFSAEIGALMIAIFLHRAELLK